MPEEKAPILFAGYKPASGEQVLVDVEEHLVGKTIVKAAARDDYVLLSLDDRSDVYLARGIVKRGEAEQA